MQLILKTQQLNPVDRKNKEVFATAVEIEPQNNEDLPNKGHIFLTISVKGLKNTDLETITSIFTDTLRKEYYKQNDDTPLYAIEKALDRAKQNAVSIGDNNKKNINISFCTALIWNRVLYISHTGAPAAYLIRNNGVKDLAKASAPDEIVTMSGLLAADDVVIIGTPAFREKFPPQEIVSNLGSLSSIAGNAKEKESIASVIIKTSTKDGKQKKNKTNILASDKIPGIVTEKISKIKDKWFAKKSLSDTYKEYQIKKPAPVTSISEIANKTATMNPSLAKTRRRKRITKTTKKRKQSAIIGVLFLSLITIIFITPKHNNKIDKTEIEATISLKRNQKSNVLGTANKKDTSILKLSKIKQGFNAIQGDVYKNGKLAILNNSDNSIYTINAEDKSFKKIGLKLENPKYFDCDSIFCFVTDNELIKTFKINAPDEVNSYTNKISNIQDIVGSNQYLYMLTDTNIYALKLGNKNSVPTPWLNKDESLGNPISIAYTGTSLFILDGRNINRYTSIDGNKGSRAPFTFDNSYLLSPVQIRANTNYLFVLNSDMNEISVVIFDNKSGEFVKKVKLIGKNEAQANVPFIVPETDGNNFYYVKNETLYKAGS